MPAYSDVIREMYPEQSVPESDVRLAFLSDELGIQFREWLSTEGMAHFNTYLTRQEAVRGQLAMLQEPHRCRCYYGPDGNHDGH